MSLRQARSDGLPQQLVHRGELVRVQVEGVRTPFYARPDAEKVLRADAGQALSPPWAIRLSPPDPEGIPSAGNSRRWIG